MSSVGANCREFRQLLDFDSPAFIIGEMKMKSVELVEGHQFEKFLDRLFGLKIPSHVQVQSTVAKPRGVGDVHRANLQLALLLAIGFNWQKGTKCLDAIKNA